MVGEGGEKNKEMKKENGRKVVVIKRIFIVNENNLETRGDWVFVTIDWKT